jgi:biotin transport system substrate-specific component
MAAGAFLSIPIGPVPIVLQNFFVMLAALVLGAKWGTISLMVYLLSGLVGLPVFAGGAGGLGKFVGPTGGYLLGYIPCVFLVGLISEKGGQKVVFDVMAMIAGTTTLYFFGVMWLKFLSRMSFAETLALGMYPFLIGDVIKMAAAAGVARVLRPIVNNYGSMAAEYGPDRS